MEFLKKELLSLVFMTIPLLYLLSIFQGLPEEVPLHWNINGEVDNVGSKSMLFLMPSALPLFIYLLLTFAVKVDPKGNSMDQSVKHRRLKTVLVMLISVLSIYILNSVQDGASTNLNYLFFVVGVLYVELGNYLKTIKPNYFLGIRTPWTLESEQVWKATHRMGSKWWFVGGLVVMSSSLSFDRSLNFWVFISVTMVIGIIPIVYSYKLYKDKS